MADVTPDWEFERMKLVRQLKQLELNKFDNEMHRVELNNDLERTENNIEAADKAIAEMKARIDGIVAPDPKEKPDG